jgi:hypothetical protein
MPTIISGDTGIDKIAAGAIEFSDLPTGSVLQVVQATYSVSTSTSAAAWSDTGLSATITPKFSSSKILVIANQMGVRKINDTSVNFNLCRNGSSINDFVTFVAGTSSSSEMGVGSCVFTFLDSPSSTSPVTYKTQFFSRSGIATVSVQYLTATSTMTLLEIAA